MKPGIYWFKFKSNEYSYYLRLHDVANGFLLVGWTENEPYENYWNDDGQTGDDDYWRKFHASTAEVIDDSELPGWINADLVQWLKEPPRR